MHNPTKATHPPPLSPQPLSATPLIHTELEQLVSAGSFAGALCCITFPSDFAFLHTQIHQTPTYPLCHTLSPPHPLTPTELEQLVPAGSFAGALRTAVLQGRRQMVYHMIQHEAVQAMEPGIMAGILGSAIYHRRSVEGQVAWH
jgi:hypothetical protein